MMVYGRRCSLRYLTDMLLANHCLALSGRDFDIMLLIQHSTIYAGMANPFAKLLHVVGLAARPTGRRQSFSNKRRSMLLLLGLFKEPFNGLSYRE
jgi:hypothetical protein